MNIDLGSNKINIKVNGEDHSCVQPTVRDVKKMTQSKDDIDGMMQLLIDIGLKKELVDSLGMYQLTTLVKSLVEPITEKK